MKDKQSHGDDWRRNDAPVLHDPRTVRRTGGVLRRRRTTFASERTAVQASTDAERPRSRGLARITDPCVNYEGVRIRSGRPSCCRSLEGISLEREVRTYRLRRETQGRDPSP